MYPLENFQNGGLKKTTLVYSVLCTVYSPGASAGAGARTFQCGITYQVPSPGASSPPGQGGNKPTEDTLKYINVALFLWKVCH